MDIKETPEDNDQTPAMGRTERKKVMGQLHISPDPARVGPDATSLQRALRAMIIGQDEAINHIVDVYQMYVTGLTAWRRWPKQGSDLLQCFFKQRHSAIGIAVGMCQLWKCSMAFIFVILLCLPLAITVIACVRR